MAKKLLIDASHREERRMAVIDGPRLQGFETESISKKQIKSNIYLAKIIRVEPSLQAAFVEYGGNRQGFLPFSEIHPDYYQIPVGDRLAAEAALAAEEAKKNESSPEVLTESPAQDPSPENTDSSSAASEAGEDALPTDGNEEGGADEDYPQKSKLRYRYKIQEVIKRKQIILIQVIREERGNKGAALSTYLSLAGKYCVMMPNSGNRTGGISRKITDVKDRKRLRAILDGLDIPEGMSLIVRTAGSERNKLELKRDFDFLLRQWSEIRDMTLASMAPALIYEEGDLIKRSLRDIYDKDMDEVLIEGEEAYKAAKALMRTMLPSHSKKVQQYKDKNTSLFQKFKIEDQIDQMFQPTVSLPSGGSIVIAQTEALVAIDVNSGRSTRERDIRETALKTNIEAAKEVARQMRLRDLAGLLVVDFIDMNEEQHIKQVEKIFKEATQEDRARIQMGKISSFGLMELSRQRLRPSILETYTRPCETCHGTGVVRSVNSMALFALRQIEAACLEKGIATLHVHVPPEVDLYLLNHKRQDLVELEQLYRLDIIVERDASLKHLECKIHTTKRELGEVIPLSPTTATAHKDLSHIEENIAVEIDEEDEISTAPDNLSEEKTFSKNSRRRRPNKNFIKKERSLSTETQEVSPPATQEIKDDIKTSEPIQETQDTENGSLQDSAEKERKRRRRVRDRRRRRGPREGGDSADQNPQNPPFPTNSQEEKTPSEGLKEVKNSNPITQNRTTHDQKRVEKEDRPNSQKTQKIGVSAGEKTPKNQPSTQTQSLAPSTDTSSEESGSSQKKGWWKRLIDS